MLGAIALVVIDQIIKLIVVLKLKESIIIIPNFFELTYVKNFGISFSKLDGKIMLIILISIVLIGVIFYLMKYYLANKYYMFGLTFMFAGAVGNFIDRFFRGFVVDYLNFNIFNYDFPVFNFADMILVCGAIFLGIIIFKEEMGKKHA